jgi:hypothetical protein
VCLMNAEFAPLAGALLYARILIYELLISKMLRFFFLEDVGTIFCSTSLSFK